MKKLLFVAVACLIMDEAKSSFVVGLSRASFSKLNANPAAEGGSPADDYTAWYNAKQQKAGRRTPKVVTFPERELPPPKPVVSAPAPSTFKMPLPPVGTVATASLLLVAFRSRREAAEAAKTKPSARPLVKKKPRSKQTRPSPKPKAVKKSPARPGASQTPRLAPKPQKKRPVPKARPVKRQKVQKALEKTLTPRVRKWAKQSKVRVQFKPVALGERFLEDLDLKTGAIGGFVVLATIVVLTFLDMDAPSPTKDSVPVPAVVVAAPPESLESAVAPPSRMDVDVSTAEVVSSTVKVEKKPTPLVKNLRTSSETSVSQEDTTIKPIFTPTKPKIVAPSTPEEREREIPLPTEAAVAAAAGASILFVANSRPRVDNEGETTHFAEVVDDEGEEQD